TALPVCPLPPGSRRRRLVLTPAQKGALQAWFQHNPYPGIASRERLAQELHIPESRIQVWFQNQRTRQLRQSRSGSGNSQGEGRKRTSISPSETSILLQAFEKNRFPSIATREHLARLTGLPEPRIQVHCPSMAPELFKVGGIAAPETLLEDRGLPGGIHGISAQAMGGSVELASERTLHNEFAQKTGNKAGAGWERSRV
uniref:Homeobox domain-containing protein n=1 Tax=Ursus americanus TaxID=9643 RepID=A0A452Q7M8_URSAM